MSFDDEFSLILDAIPRPIIIKDADSRFLFLNHAACVLVGKSRDELIGGTDHDILPPDEANRIRDMDQHVLATGQDVSFEEEITFADGSTGIFVTQKHRVELGGKGLKKNKLIVVTTRDVTARRKAEAELRASEEHYRSLVELHPQVPWTASPSGEVLEAGPRWQEITGFEPAEALGTGWRKAVHPDDLSNAERQWSRSIATGDPLDVEFRLAATKGDYRWFRSRAAARRSGDGSIVRWYGLLEDVDAIRRSIESLKESEARFRSIADDAPVMIWVTDESGAGTYHSRLWHEMTGRNIEQAQGSEWTNAVHPDDRSEVEAVTSRVFRLRENLQIEYRLQRADGGSAWVIDVGRPRFAPDGRFLGYVGIALDITERRRAELAREEADALIRSVFDSTPDGLRLLDLEGRPVLLNGAGRRLFGADENAQPGSIRMPNSMSPVEAAKVEAVYSDVRRGKTTHTETSISDADGAKRYLDIITAPVASSSGGPERMLEIWRDVTEARLARDEAEAARLEAERLAERLSGTLESTMDSVLGVDHNWRINYFNTKAKNLLELDERAIGQSLWQLFPVDEGSLFAVSYRRVMTDRISTTFEDYLPARRVWFEVHAAPTSEGMSIFFRDITTRRNLERERLLAERQIHHMARHDAVTGLPNLQFLREAFENLANDPPQPETRMAILSLGLNGFKVVNDTHGQAQGELLLRRVVERLRSCVEEQAIVARSGDEEFIIVVPDVRHNEDATKLAEEIIGSVGTVYDLEGTQADIAVSAGIAFAPDDGRSADQLLKGAGIALYRAMASGPGTYLKFEPAMDAHLQAGQQIKGSLRRALANNEFELYYQPLINLRTREVTACEALVRWTHRELGPISPVEFIPAAEETGLIEPLGEWVLHEACTAAAKWPAHVSVAVNLSPLQFRAGRLAAVIKDTLRVTGLDATRLQLEITESVFLHDSEGNLQILQEIRMLGVKIAMDDFGTGYSSLGYLRSFPFDKIKVDRSFIHDLPKGKESLAILRAVAGIGRSLGITTTVEGVENRKQLKVVEAEGFDEAQGYLFARPLPAGRVLEAIRAGQTR